MAVGLASAKASIDVVILATEREIPINPTEKGQKEERLVD